MPPQTAETGQPVQSLYEYSADREFEFAGFKGFLKDLIELCPVKGDSSRMTPEAIDNFTVKVYEASGEAVPDQFAHLTQPSRRQQEDTKSDKPFEKEKQGSEEATKSRQVEALEESKATNVLTTEEVKTAKAENDLSPTLPTALLQDKEIAVQARTESQPEKIVASLITPDEAKLQEVVAHYDSLQRTAEIDYAESRQGIEGRELSLLSEAVITDNIPEQSTVSLGEVKNFVTSPVAEFTEPASEILGYHETVPMDVNVAASELEDYHVEIPEMSEAIQKDLEPASIDDLQEEVVSQIMAEFSDFRTEFSMEEAAEIDELLGFDEHIAAQKAPEYEEVSMAEVVESKAVYSAKKSPKTDFAELVYVQIEDMSEKNRVEAPQALAELEIIHELAVEIAVLDIDLGSNPKQLEQLKAELLLHIETLLESMGKCPNEIMVRRFTERVLLSEIQKLLDTQLEPQDEGTHEKHLTFTKFVNDLARLDEVTQRFAEALGRKALLLAVS